MQISLRKMESFLSELINSTAVSELQWKIQETEWIRKLWTKSEKITWLLEINPTRMNKALDLAFHCANNAAHSLAKKHRSNDEEMCHGIKAPKWEECVHHASHWLACTLLWTPNIIHHWDVVRASKARGVNQKRQFSCGSLIWHHEIPNS